MPVLKDPQLSEQITRGQPFLWCNPALNVQSNGQESGLTMDDIHQADARLRRFAPLLTKLFPELVQAEGLIESELLAIPAMQEQHFADLPGRLMVKGDHALPVAGSIKARGGIHEVLCHAEQLAFEQGLLHSEQDDYLILTQADAKALFSQHEIAVSSTGNLGLSIGIISAALGFRVVVHMSVEAKQWKKVRLRDRGVTVVEHSEDYSAAVAAGRAASDADPQSYFVDDENSPRLFLGYAVAALRLQQQLRQQQIPVDAAHPLFVYIPCGVGGAPGGINFGLKQVFGPHVHCFFVEPVQAPCVLMGMQATDLQQPPSVYELGLKVKTEADGLAVSMASAWVCEVLQPLLSGILTVSDDTLFHTLCQLWQTEGLAIEPSAAAGFSGPGMLLNSPAGQTYLQQHSLTASLQQATHLVWTTGGLFVPPAEMDAFRQRGAALQAIQG